MVHWEEFETLRIETPEGLDLYLPLAGFGPRFLGFLIDMVIVSVVQGLLLFAVIMVITFGAVGSAMGSSAAPGDEAFMTLFIVIMVLTILVLLLAPVLYFFLFESMWHGQTPGKRAAGIRVIRRGGYPAGRREIFTRNIMRIVDMLPSNWMVGLVSFFATQNQQRVGDLVADTVVVREFAGKAPLGSGAVPALTADQRPEAAATAPGQLTPTLSYIISSYLSRAAQLDIAVRDKLSLRCIEALGYPASHLTLLQREQYLASIAHAGWSGQ